jgi:hypothetical protein
MSRASINLNLLLRWINLIESAPEKFSEDHHRSPYKFSPKAIKRGFFHQWNLVD